MSDQVKLPVKLWVSDISILVESLTAPLGILASVILLIPVFPRVWGSVSGSGNIGDTAHVVRGRWSEALGTRKVILVQ